MSLWDHEKIKFTFIIKLCTECDCVNHFQLENKSIVSEQRPVSVFLYVHRRVQNVGAESEPNQELGLIEAHFSFATKKIGIKSLSIK